MEQKIRWGIIGLGGIAHKFANDLNLVDGAEITAVASRSMDKAAVFAKQYQAKHAFGSYKDLFECDEVDVVYIATPHTGHKEWSIMAMEHGKHVLCEKPMGIDRSDIETMIAVAGKHQVFLMEALWSRFNPSIRKAKAMVDAGEIGPLGYLHADFAFYALDRPEEGRLLNPDLGGGSLLDIGIYPVFLSYLLLGMPETIKSSSKFYKTGVEIQTSMIFDYPKAQAILYSGLTSESKMEAEISGSTGSIFLNGQWHIAQGYSLKKGKQIDAVELPTPGNGYTYEIEEVNSCLRKGKLQSDLWSHQNSLDLAELLETIRVQNGIKFPFEQ
ncbi:Gfo/Idh/MocA family oxidoreductase [Maribacter polysiphoniae]|uniref:Gfo/Idh/MocA family oxidoreductase n=1 Tax=Maribacter polysiphoniae TaxID=429344 RepID=A0A316EHH5_9FLAO|nr:Gfo/Idh/MocA family oxidoreductase [Maribacter polysiphoniae]MBD1261761.1 Gfo/Idh/MocA family oxidoreductase [Maribacter polysiphoniae]PWK22430.1 putative dehydrogenase [Maribacter polysiphoniae]